MKELIINGVEYAKYLIEGKHISIKVTNLIWENEIQNSENFCIMIISMIERVDLETAGF